VKFVLPRHELSGLLGISYRRIPVLAIGNDVYCDTSLIASALERRFPVSMGFGTIFPPRKDGGKIDIGIIRAFSRYYAENALFPLAFTLLQWDRLPSSFVQDRSDVRISCRFSPFDVSKPLYPVPWISHRP
jgi:glutathione S-transferase